MTPEDVVRDYYEALRRGEPLYPYFAERDSTAKVGVWSVANGYDAVAESLREQTRTTDDWHVESTALTTDSAGGAAWFSDAVELAWTDTATDDRHRFETRWTGTLVSLDEEWQFVTMHVSTAGED